MVMVVRVYLTGTVERGTGEGGTLLNTVRKSGVHTFWHRK
jgi:hypothetical protein